MIEPITFTLAVLALLAAPGPTNALAATSGAAAGFNRSLALIPAAVLGYLISTIALALIVGPLVEGSRVLNIALRAACGAFLLYAAWKLWREGGMETASDAPVSFRRLLLATSLNPKSILFAFVIVPYLPSRDMVAAAPYLAALAVMTALVVGGWIALGATVRANARGVLAGGLVRRVGALVLCVFAALISASALSA